ncbi:MAG TPA: hypothetical protein PLZ95_20650 [Bryobacteraceae bacterium]|nr:hypothetical protein [Bryobacteraceae bacterium]
MTLKRMLQASVVALAFDCLAAAQPFEIKANGPRSLEAAVDQLTLKTGWPICIEEPAWEQVSGKSEGATSNPKGKWVQPPPHDKLTISFAPPRAKDRDTFVRSLAAAYNTEGQHWTVQVKQVGEYHVLVPRTMRKADGRSEAAASALDLIVEVPRERRDPEGHLFALAAAIERQIGAYVVPEVRGSQLNGMFGGGTVAWPVWGSSGVTAREAILSLIADSATTLTWRFICYSGIKPEPATCYLALGPITLEVRNRHGKLANRMLLHDRRHTGSPLPQAPPSM